MLELFGSKHHKANRKCNGASVSRCTILLLSAMRWRRTSVEFTTGML